MLRDNVGAGTEESSPTSSTVRGRLHLLEWSVLMQRDELARSKRLFVRDITDLQVRDAFKYRLHRGLCV